METTRSTRKTLKLTGVMYEDVENGGVAGYFLEFPEVIAEANSKEELKNVLMENLAETLEYLAEDNRSHLIGENYSTESFELALWDRQIWPTGRSNTGVKLNAGGRSFIQLVNPTNSKRANAPRPRDGHDLLTPMVVCKVCIELEIPMPDYAANAHKVYLDVHKRIEEGNSNKE